MAVRLGNYLLVERLNQGGMADVYLAKTFGFEGADQLMAVKCIRPEIAEDPVFIRMFIDEAKLAVLLDHANIAQTYELGRIEATYFIAMEYVVGRDLRALIDRARARGVEIPVPLVLHITAQVCEGLDYAHRKADPTGKALNIVHRDVSPQNVLVSYDGGVKLIDFGIAKAASQASRSQAGVLKGKYGYMSPEQVRGKSVDHRSDVFATGVLFWELLTRERLFPGTSDFSVLEKVRHAEVYPPTLVVPNTHKDIEDVVMRALTLKPKNRYSSCSDMRDAIIAAMLKQYGGPPSPRDLASLMSTLFPAELQESQALYERTRRYKQMPEDVAPLGQPGEGSAPNDDGESHPGSTPDTVPTGDASVGASTTVDPSKPAPKAEPKPEPPKPEPQLTEDTPVSPGPPEGMAEAMERDREAAREAVRVPGRRFVGSAQPTAVTSVYPGRHRWRDIIIVVAAILVAGGLVVGTWLGTRGAGGLERGGAVIITAPEGASVVIDGVQLGLTPFSSPALTEGSHIVTLKKDGHLVTRREIEVVSGKVVELRVDLVRAP